MAQEKDNYGGDPANMGMFREHLFADLVDVELGKYTMALCDLDE